MMLELVRWLDVGALWLIWWCAIAGLIAGHAVRDWYALALSFGLIGAMVCAFAGAIIITVQVYYPPWWVSGLILSCAVVAVWLYEYRFGIRRQFGLVRRWLSSLPPRRAT